MKEWFAHSQEGADESNCQPLSDHLNNSSKTAGEFAAEFDCEPWGRAAGTLHDAGKATEAFQERLHGSPKRVDHSTAGALIARARYGAFGTLLAYMIIGHHGGLPNATEQGKRHSLLKRLSAPIEPYDSFFDLIDSGEVKLPKMDELMKSFNRERPYGATEKKQKCMAYSVFLLSKMLHSCLVDADYLDTESFCAPEQAQVRKKEKEGHPSLLQLQSKLEDYMEQLQKGKGTHSLINRVRNSIYEDCLKTADNDPGLFTFTVPTGGGKTLSSLAFALRHAIRNGQRRIIYAIPFTSIVEQTASVFKDIFGENAVLEHHSNFDLGDLDEEGRLKHRLAVQNWDAPIVVTTNVQFFESLYSHKPSKCRKLHNMVKSVVILDEAQTLPDSLLEPSLAALEELTLGYKTSVVLCTATQPALSSRWPFGAQPQEIVTDRSLFEEAFEQRVRYVILDEVEEDDLVARIVSESQTLCIVGTRKEARTLYEIVKAELQSRNNITADEGLDDIGIFHLSASMVPVHRSKVLTVIRERLRLGKPCRVISTQLVEAGVDIDFPVVYREMAGLDSIIQAGGRCNREGKGSMGTVYIFDYCVAGERQTTSAWLEKMKVIGRNTLRERKTLDDDAITQFFEARYRSHDTDGKGIFSELSDKSMVTSGFEKYEFEHYSNDFHLIDNTDVSIFVPWGNEGKKLLARLIAAEFPALLARELQRYVVNVPAFKIGEYCDKGLVYRIEPFYVLHIDDAFKEFYREDVGLLVPGEEGLKLLFS